MSKRQLLFAACLTSVVAALSLWLLPPKTLAQGREVRIAADQYPPYTFWNQSGKVTGFAAEMINEAARRRGYSLVWVRPPLGVDAALRAGTIDIVPALTILPSRLKDMRFSKPWLRNDFCLVSLNSNPVRSAHSLNRVSIAHVNGPVTTMFALRLPGGPVLRPVSNRLETFNAVCRGQARAAFIETRVLQQFLLHRTPECQSAVFAVDPLPKIYADIAIASTPGASHIADDLRAEIDQIREDGIFGPRMAYWNPITLNDTELLFVQQAETRKHRLYAATIGTLIILALLLWRQNRRVLRARRAADLAANARLAFVAEASHGLRTPLTAVLAATEVLRSAPLSPEQRHHLSLILDAGREIARRLDDITLSTPTPAPPPPSPPQNSHSFIGRIFTLRNHATSL